MRSLLTFFLLTYLVSWACFLGAAIALAWIYWRTNRSVLLTMLLHAAINNTKDIVPSVIPGGSNPLTLGASFVGWTSAALLWICAFYFLFQTRRAELPAEEQRTAAGANGYAI